MSPIALSRRQILAGVAVAVPVGAIASVAPTQARAATEPGPTHAQQVVTRYFGILNAGMTSADADFTALATVYTGDAVLTASSPAGVTTVYHGLDAVMGFYVAAWQNLHGITWAQDQVRNLAAGVVLSYEHAGRPAQTKPGRCAHLFKVHRDLISSLDWVTFYPGVP